MGTAIPTVSSEAYFIDTEYTGNFNRVFEQVTPSSGLQVYSSTYPPNSLILVQMVASDTLWIEGIAEETPPEQQVFSEAKTVFVR